MPALEEILTQDNEWRAINGEADGLRAKKNQAADEIGKLKREKKDDSGLLGEMEGVKARLKELEEKAKVSEDKISEGLLNIPNVPEPSVTVGTNESQNRVLRQWGTPKNIAAPKDHQELGENWG